MFTLNFKIFFNISIFVNNIGDSKRMVVAPSDRGPNKAYVWPLIHPASEAVKTNDPDSNIIKNFLQSSKLSSELAFMYGQEAGMTVEAMLARTKILVNEMLKPLNNNYANISILLNKYGEKCKSMLDTPEVRNQFWINKAYEKYKWKNF